VGCLHVRPVLNLKDPADIHRMRSVAEECFSIVRAYKGSHSGEHGDGIVRSEFHAQMFGERIVAAFETVKKTFDPEGLLNPNRIVHPPRMDDRALFRYGPDYAPRAAAPPVLDWSAHPGALLGAVEMCNNNGACRGFDTEVMCPSYRATRDEAHVVRGRANTLRLALTGQLRGEGLASDAVHEALKLCVSCKACRRECPTGVDMARMKIEATTARAESHGIALRERLIAALPRLAPYAAALAPLANLRNRSATLRRLGERHFGIAADRKLPAWRRDAFRDSEASAQAPRAPLGEVLLLADTFNRWFEPETLRAGIRVLAAAGWRAVVPYAGGTPFCCGRTELAAGRPERARAAAARLLAAYAGDRPVVGLEPSCLFTLRDEFLALVPGAAADSLAARAMTLPEFLQRHAPSLAFRPQPGTAHVHGHCHQKSFGAFAPALAALRRIPALDVRPIAASCCGMAGSFGYQTETSDASRAMAELALLPAVRAAEPQAIIVADGTSCRHQIRDLGGRTALHSARVLAQALEPASLRA
jgi:Fe-S oxidoreductase